MKGKNNVVVDALSRIPSISLMDVAENWKATLEVEYAKDKYRIYLVHNSNLKEEILKKAHDSTLAGHSGFFKTYRILRERFSWKDLKDDVLKYVSECPTCQKNKVYHTHPTSLLHPFPIPEQKWEIISMDFITGLTKVFGKDCIFVVVDRLNQFSHLFVVTTTFIAAQEAELFFK